MLALGLNPHAYVGSSLAPLDFCLLEEIGRTQWDGLVQQNAAKLLNTNPKIMFLSIRYTALHIPYTSDARLIIPV